MERIFAKPGTSSVLPSAIECIYVKSVGHPLLIWTASFKTICHRLGLGQFEKRERPKVIADGHRDAIIDCLYKNTNTGDVSDRHIFKVNARIEPSSS